MPLQPINVHIGDVCKDKCSLSRIHFFIVVLAHIIIVILIRVRKLAHHSHYAPTVCFKLSWRVIDTIQGGPLLSIVIISSFEIVVTHFSLLS